ncbi:arf-GAP with dual PH domain-containing protein 2-like isoform X1 [Gouania willdenowi]|uniref:arf-GAP with dual PH domain-containing protein 2-like isoform X1 n=2 Tax=Gouania willdenowi TaxID=441366 RepID=UPI00105436EC|nr:arf-GAP with dual PH domain-containing protein 2-like isoform X1 [Gouania willdenowi]
MASLDRNNKILLDLVKQPGNNLCADCQAPEPDWASYTLGVFVCLNCCGMHRNLPAISKVKSIRLDHWEDSLVEFMQQRGNSVVKALYEKCVPAFFYHPGPKDCGVLREQWIRAKYERREFTGENSMQRSYSSDQYESVLWKKGKNNKQYQRTIFLLSKTNFTLSYYIKDDCKGPKAVISMKDLNAVFQPEKISHVHGLWISYPQEDYTRNLFVYHEDGQEIVSFFNALRATRLAYLQRKHPSQQIHQLASQITTPIIKEGYMEKTGPTQKESFRKRWFCLCLRKRTLLYFKSPLDAAELGAVFLGSESHGYAVSESRSQSVRGSRWHCEIKLQTPKRHFVFRCEEEGDQREWLEAFRNVISQPMTPEDYAYEATHRRWR